MGELGQEALVRRYRVDQEAGQGTVRKAESLTLGQRDGGEEVREK